MSSKINRSSFFLSVIVSLIYSVCWILLSSFLNTSSAFSAAAPIQPAAFQFFYGFLYIFVPLVFVFLLMRTQINRFVLVQSELKTAKDTLEDRVQSRTAELEKSINDIKILKGIITICANCKSIRNGKGHWESVESYIGRHTEAEFSHGLCKDCQNSLYGENYSRLKNIPGP
jgi:C4-dicarboxylate-specific signal transduction histidine kinase